ncbi:MAG: alpha/beta hydrolase [Ignavibacteriae bacterium]|nr:alpha/beta hydrolase [Ignavibacteriota bacterium]NOG99221.1 alpha/beta hydrolase [Ignavibacteriota bacterium]
MKKFIITALLFLTSINIAQTESQEPVVFEQITIKDTELQFLYSTAVEDTFYLYIKLPKGYGESDKRYPILYLLDGDIAFPMASSIVRYLQYGSHVPDIIIVGIGYGSMMNDNEVNYRSRDYNPPETERRGLKGEGDEYLSFLKNELLPYFDKNYRTIASDRTISGHSLSGQFAIYALLNEPQLFNRYIASSPHMIRSIDSFLEKEEMMSPVLKNIDANLFISQGEDEPDSLYAKPINKLLSSLKESNYKGLKIKHKIFNEGSHFVCPPEAMSYGLKFVFEK